MARGARSTTGGGDWRTVRTPTGLTARESFAGRPSPELAGDVPKTGRRGYILNSAGDCALLWFFPFVPVAHDVLVCVSAVLYALFSPSRCVSYSVLSSLVRVSVAWSTLLPFHSGVDTSVCTPFKKTGHGASRLDGRGFQVPAGLCNVGKVQRVCARQCDSKFSVRPLLT